MSELGNLLFGNSRGNFHVDRRHQSLFWSLMEEIQVKDPSFNPGYGYSSTQYEGKNIGFKNDTFLIRSYYWGDCDCGAEDETDESICDHKDDCSLMLNNFIYFPTSYTLQWYKYPLRDSYANKSLSDVEFINMINECIKSLK